MPIDPNIALQVKPIELQNPIAQYAQMQQIQGMQNQSRLADLMYNEKQREVDQSSALNNIYRTSLGEDGKIDRTKLYRDVAAGGIGSKLPGLQKGFSDADEAQGKVDKQKADLIDAKLKQSRAFLDTVTTPEQYIAWHEANHRDPVLGPELAARGVTADQARASIMESIKKPGGFEQLLQKSALGIEKFTESNKPTVHVQNLGGTSQVISTPGMGGAPSVLSNTPITQSADSVATDARVASEGRLNRANSLAVQDRITARQPAGTKLEQEDITTMAEQYLAGDKSVLQGLGRGAQGAEDIRAVRAEIGKQLRAKGMGGADAAAKIAEYGGLVTGLRATGNISARVENAAEEAAQLAPLALAASKNVVRSGLLPFGKLQDMFDVNTNNPALADFATKNTGLATAYASAMARGGKATVSDNEHARKLLSTAKDGPAYEATVNAMLGEIEAAKRAPRNVRAGLSGEISGRGNSHGAPASAKPSLDDIFGKK